MAEETKESAGGKPGEDLTGEPSAGTRNSAPRAGHRTTSAKREKANEKGARG